MAKWTIQSLIDERMRLDAYCHNHLCHHHQPLDLMNLRDKLGPDAEAMSDDLVPKLRCSKCGGKQIGLIYSTAGGARWADTQGLSSYAKSKGL